MSGRSALFKVGVLRGNDVISRQAYTRKFKIEEEEHMNNVLPYARNSSSHNNIENKGETALSRTTNNGTGDSLETVSSSGAASLPASSTSKQRPLLIEIAPSTLSVFSRHAIWLRKRGDVRLHLSMNIHRLIFHRATLYLSVEMIDRSS